MSISSISFMGRRDNTEAPKRTRNKREKKTSRGVDVQILNDNDGRVIIKAKDDFLKIRFDNRRNNLREEPTQDTYTSVKKEEIAEEQKKPEEQTKPQTKTEEENVNKDVKESQSTEKTKEQESVKEEENEPFCKGILQDLRKELAPKLARLVLAVCTVALSSLGIKVGTDKLDEIPENKQVIYDSKTNNIDNISDTYNVDEDVLLYINNFDNKNDISNTSQIKIPSSYDYLNSKTQELTKKLYKSKNAEETKKYGEELDKIKQKTIDQKEIANMYTDGEFVYICLKDFSQNATIANKYDGLNIDTYTIENLFDIKEGALKRYNTIDNMGYKLDENNRKIYAEYDYPVIPSGTILKVKKDAINEKNPNLDYTLNNKIEESNKLSNNENEQNSVEDKESNE